MISFELSEEQEVVREAMHEFAQQAMRPLMRDADEESKLPEELLGQLHELGLIATQLPEEFGGGGEPRSATTNALLEAPALDASDRRRLEALVEELTDEDPADLLRRRFALILRQRTTNSRDVGPRW